MRTESQTRSTVTGLQYANARTANVCQDRLIACRSRRVGRRADIFRSDED